MNRWTFFGSAASAACARATGPVSACERYSIPAGDLYWTDWPNAADAMPAVATTVAAMSLDDRAIGFAPRFPECTRIANWGQTQLAMSEFFYPDHGTRRQSVSSPRHGVPREIPVPSVQSPHPRDADAARRWMRHPVRRTERAEHDAGRGRCVRHSPSRHAVRGRQHDRHHR